jgi:hypothetical protein
MSNINEYSPGFTPNELQAARAHAFASTHPIGVIGRYPVTSIISIVAVAALMIISSESGRSDREAANDAWYRAKLDCRLSGGTYEYFGTQGYHCIGRTKSTHTNE